jgi:hypothetical protein
MNFSPLRTAALAAVLLCSPVILSAQEAAPEDDPVVATVNGKAIHKSKVMQAALRLPPQAQAQLDQIFPILVERMVDFELLTNAATEAGMAKDEEVLSRIAELTEGVMREVYLTREVEAGVTEAALRERYDATARSSPPWTKAATSPNWPVKSRSGRPPRAAGIWAISRAIKWFPSSRKRPLPWRPAPTPRTR